MAEKSTKKLKLSKSLYPLDFNRENRMEGYQEWLTYISKESRKGNEQNHAAQHDQKLIKLD